MNGRSESINVPRRILTLLLSSLASGVVPREGAPYIAIGRTEEIKALLGDLDKVGEGMGAMRFIIGRYGSGKSFLMQLVRGYALDKNFVTADADLSPERRLYGSKGSGVATYRELIKNLATKASPDGGALPKIIARWISSVQFELAEGGTDPESAEFIALMNQKIFSTLREMESLVGGFDFARIITEYYKAYVSDDSNKKSACLKWLRGEYSTKTEARAELGIPVSVIIDDNNWYDFIKLWSSLVRRLGYSGLIIFIDECVNLYKITHRIGRESNYEKILAMFNDVLQGRASGLGIIMGGTPQFLEDPRRGLYSYEALRSRLCDSRFSTDEYKNMMGPVIRLVRLSDDEIYALISRVTKLYSQFYEDAPSITPENIKSFLEVSLVKVGADSLVTPREMLRDYMTVLNIMMQNKNIGFEQIVFGKTLDETAADNSSKLTSGVVEDIKDGQISAKHKICREAVTAEDIEF